MSSVMSLWTRSASDHAMFPNWSLKGLRIRQPVQVRLRLGPAAGRRHRLDLAVFVR
jgi:hypothetical protein